ncbi:GtrA family protein [Trinickia sp. EG282A]|uniref:GtrA family protein n=1 Tax=Trinickia sp. EG282A TaxID=3237013 RepID=UPI0034D2EC94
MSRWRNESAILIRYAGSGAVNTIAGIGLIFFFMKCGVSPILANVAGYTVGLALSFFLSKKIVFCSDGHVAAESLRFLVAFALCFFANIAVLHVFVNLIGFGAGVSQLIAAATYTGSMYFAARWYVFKVASKPSNPC